MNKLSLKDLKLMCTELGLKKYGSKMIIIDRINKFKPQPEPRIFYYSHETENDFFIFYTELLELTKNLRIRFRPKYIMQDALTASYAAAMAIFPNTTILICYFHVKKNIKDNKSVPDNVYIIRDIESIHVSINETQFISRLELFEVKYKHDHSEMYHYISKQLFTGRCNKWQIFQTPPGYAATNSNI